MRWAAAPVIAPIVAVLIAVLPSGSHAADAPLSRMNLERTITVSGISSGGYMATQFQLAHARVVKGAGIFAAGPWFCARGSMTRALAECFDKPTSAPGTPELIATAKREAAAGRIDPVAALADDRVWVFRGSRDDKVAPQVTQGLVDFYRAFVPAASLAYVSDVPAAHGVPTARTGAACGTTAEPYLNACDYDGVGRMLAHLYGTLAPAVAPRAAALRTFDQSAHDPDGSLAAQGYVYVPAACTAGAPACRLHVAFHGCRQGAEFAGQAFVRDAGYGGWAESNRIVVLFPQAKKSVLLPFNPQGCWDWWGYSGEGYATRSGAQIAAVRAMVKALAGI